MLDLFNVFQKQYLFHHQSVILVQQPNLSFHFTLFVTKNLANKLHFVIFTP